MGDANHMKGVVVVNQAKIVGNPKGVILAVLKMLGVASAIQIALRVINGNIIANDMRTWNSLHNVSPFFDHYTILTAKKQEEK